MGEYMNFEQQISNKIDFLKDDLNQIKKRLNDISSAIKKAEAFLTDNHIGVSGTFLCFEKGGISHSLAWDKNPNVQKQWRIYYVMVELLSAEDKETRAVLVETPLPVRIMMVSYLPEFMEALVKDFSLMTKENQINTKR